MKELTEGMALLFESALEPVIGTDGENIVFMNPAAVSAFGDHRGAEFSALLPEAVRTLAPGQVAAVTLCGKRASLRAASAGGLTVYFAAVEAPAPALPERAGFLPELRSLLSALKLAADRLSESAEAAGDAAGTERAAIVQHTCAQLQRLVGNASLAGDIESGSVSFRPENLDLDELCRSTTWTAEFFARSRGIEVVYSGPEEPVWIGADRVMMEILLLNLISNSLLHLREGGRLEVSLTRRGGRIVLAVDDTGSGMTQQELSRLFTGGASGQGIWLRLVRDIAELHGGAFIIEGREGRGASARVMLQSDIRPGSGIFRSTGVSEGPGHMGIVLVQLATWLSSKDYDPRLLD